MKRSRIVFTLKPHASLLADMRGFLVVGLFIVTVVLLLAGQSTPTCTNPPAGPSSWADVTIVYHAFERGAQFKKSEKTQIEQGLSRWSTANQSSGNGSGVQFLPASRNHPALLIIKTGPTLPGEFSRIDTITSNETIVSATITINKQAVFPNSTILVYDPLAAGADTFFLKATLHEIGHSMGLEDIPTPPSGQVCDQLDGGSVMNTLCNQNDRGGNNPTDVTPCDNSVVKNPGCADPCFDASCTNYDPAICVPPPPPPCVCDPFCPAGCDPLTCMCLSPLGPVTEPNAVLSAPGQSTGPEQACVATPLATTISRRRQSSP